MEEMKHTPAPWEVCEQERGRVTGPVVGIGGCISTVATAGYGLRSNAEAEANARLISAAPDLLVACRMVLDDPGLTASANDVIRAAIAKAEGQS